MEIMSWQKLLSTKRTGLEQYHEEHKDSRTEFQRDYDRLIFSSSFRRLQNKTQVFPLPGSVFVHNRLTHSLEVASVGRSVSNAVVELMSRTQDVGVLSPHFNEIGSIVSAACLAHDLGNPPFGHSGEKAISTFFSEQKGMVLKSQVSNVQWSDIIRFEGNANAFRLLTHQFNGRRNGGFALTYSTLASIVKYPYESQFSTKSKFGFFQSEKNIYERIAKELGIIRNPDDSNRYARFPLVFLVEAADDICYQIMDIEDAYKLKILTYDETVELLMAFMPEKRERVERIFEMVTDYNERIVYLRTSVMGKLIDACAGAFVKNEAQIMSGHYLTPLINTIEQPLNDAYKNASEVAFKRIYSSSEVVDVELGGYKIISQLLEVLIEAVFHPEKAYSRQIINRVPLQYDIKNSNTYFKILAILDYISGMTDVYALDLYRKINGMSLPTL